MLGTTHPTAFCILHCHSFCILLLPKNEVFEAPKLTFSKLHSNNHHSALFAQITLIVLIGKYDFEMPTYLDKASKQCDQIKIAKSL